MGYVGMARLPDCPLDPPLHRTVLRLVRVAQAAWSEVGENSLGEHILFVLQIMLCWYYVWLLLNATFLYVYSASEAAKYKYLTASGSRPVADCPYMTVRAGWRWSSGVAGGLGAPDVRADSCVVLLRPPRHHLEGDGRPLEQAARARQPRLVGELCVLGAVRAGSDAGLLQLRRLRLRGQLHRRRHLGRQEDQQRPHGEGDGGSGGPGVRVLRLAGYWHRMREGT